MDGEHLAGDPGGEQRGGLMVGVPGGEGAEVLRGLDVMRQGVRAPGERGQRGAQVGEAGGQPVQPQAKEGARRQGRVAALPASGPWME
ncbi:hypothetical protein OG413_40775 [Streptomyces sp. NBC_01433]|uniref:hypothetical protein n=1 Tax=Streptomyces sp. NBC_01433 TaxID=2903864 RepID=UPI002258B25B|nr:hypothetical protein [Streptomyces sp. NBC_01433]MCX4681537.1 hypothetical protein [Streptomyces sp. NBC_01433]